MTDVVIVGNMTADPEVKTIKGTPMAAFSLAVTESYYDKDSNAYKDGTTSFYNCEVWGKAAESLTNNPHLCKGQRVIVMGKQTVESFTRKDGSQGTKVKVRVNEVGVSLRFPLKTGSYNQQQPWDAHPHYADQSGYSQPNTVPQQSYQQPPAPQQQAAPNQYTQQGQVQNATYDPYAAQANTQPPAPQQAPPAQPQQPYQQPPAQQAQPPQAPPGQASYSASNW